MRRIVVLFLLLAGFNAQAQIVNIESKRMQTDTTGWLGRAGVSLAFIKNVQEVLSTNVNAHVQYKTDRNLYLLLGSYNLLMGNGERLTDNMFYHLRFNRKLNSFLRWEAFTQWQQDVVANLDKRILAGTGPRFRIFEKEKFRLYAATAAMFEYEKEKGDQIVEHRDMRSSNYVSFTWLPNEVLELVSTTFYQPLFRQLNDYRVLNQLSLNIKAGRRFTISTMWNYLYDAFPAGDSPTATYSLVNGVSYSF